MLLPTFWGRLRDNVPVDDDVVVVVHPPVVAVVVRLDADVESLWGDCGGFLGCGLICSCGCC